MKRNKKSIQALTILNWYNKTNMKLVCMNIYIYMCEIAIECKYNMENQNYLEQFNLPVEKQNVEYRKRDFKSYFILKAHCTEHPSRGCPHLVLIFQLGRRKQCG